MAEPVPPDEEPLGELLDALLAQRPSLLEELRYAALPERFDPPFLAYVHGERSPDESIADLMALGLLTAVAPDRYAVPESWRPLILARWRTAEPAACRQAEARAAAYFAEQPPADTAAGLAYVYHQLGADDEAGVAALVAAYDGAVAGRRFGFARRLLKRAEAQLPVLGPAARTWVRYLRLALTLAEEQPPPVDEAQRELAALLASGPAPVLRARIRLTQGDLLQAGRRWSAALVEYAAAADDFAALQRPLDQARALARQGRVYLQLANSLGGLPIDHRPRDTRWLLREAVPLAPFLIYRWLSRRLYFLPNLFYSINYQDWVTLRLFGAAIDAFRQARQRLASAAGRPEAGILATDLALLEADLLHQTGRWALAERELARLAEQPLVTDEPYRLATWQFAAGRTELARGRYAPAEEQLGAAQATFARFGDRRAAAQAARLRGDAALAAGRREAAVAAYSAGLEAAVDVQDLLLATAVHEQLTAVVADPPPLTERAYLARFPGATQRLFQRLAAYVLLPISYLTLLVVALLIVLIGLFGEAQAAVGVSFLPEVGLLTAATLGVVWLYFLLYAGAGWIFSHLPLRLLVGRRPTYILTAPEGIVVRQAAGDELLELRWRAVTDWISADRCLTQTPLSLFSRQYLAGEDALLTLPGTLSQYRHLRRDLAERLSRAAAGLSAVDLDFALLRGRWLVGALLLAGLMTAVHLSGQLDPQKEPPIPAFQTGEVTADLVVTAVLLVGSLWTLVLVPLAGVIRLLWLRASLRRQLGERWSATAEPGWPLWLALAGLLVMLFILAADLVA